MKSRNILCGLSIAVVLHFGVLAGSAQYAYSTNADGSIYTYSTNADGSANILAYTGPPWVVTIPTNINGLTVTSIGEDAFEFCPSLTSVTIPNSVTSIGVGAFVDCTSLTNVTIPGSVTNIGVFPFWNCTSLTAITVDAQNPVYNSVIGVLFDKSQATLLEFPPGLGGDYTIPSSVTNIGEAAFATCSSLTSVTIDNGVTSIGESAFEDDSLTSVTIPGSVTSIGDDAFAYCNGLTKATIGNGVTSIGVGAFAECPGLTSVTIGSGVTSIGEDAFLGTALTSVTIPASVTNIGEYAFYDDSFSLTRVYFQGNSPSPTNDSTVFYGESYGDPATIYYLPGTTGWGAMFDGLPTALWFLPNPQILNHSAGFGVQPGGFGFTISWATNASVVVEAATNLANPVWIPVSTNILTGGSSYFSDPQWTNYSGRFYRIQLSP